MFLKWGINVDTKYFILILCKIMHNSFKIGLVSFYKTWERAASSGILQQYHWTKFDEILYQSKFNAEDLPKCVLFFYEIGICESWSTKSRSVFHFIKTLRNFFQVVQLSTHSIWTFIRWILNFIHTDDRKSVIRKTVYITYSLIK